MLAEALTSSTSIGIGLALTLGGLIVGFIVKTVTASTSTTLAVQANRKDIDKSIGDIETLDERVNNLERQQDLAKAREEGARQAREKLLSESSAHLPRPREKTRGYSQGPGQ